MALDDIKFGSPGITIPTGGGDNFSSFLKNYQDGLREDKLLQMKKAQMAAMAKERELARQDRLAKDQFRNRLLANADARAADRWKTET